MRRKKFVKTMGVGIASVYLNGILASCKKNKPKPKDDETPTLGSGPDTPGNPPGVVTVNIIDGYTEKLSYKAGDEIKIFVNVKEQQNGRITLENSRKHIITYLNGEFFPQKSGPDPYKNGYAYDKYIVFSLPSTVKSGLYFLGGKIPFIVRNENRTGSIVAVLPSNTDNAYNNTGGLSSYTDPLSPFLSFQRPYVLQSWSAHFWPWAEGLPYDIDYINDADLDNYDNFSYAKVLIIPGHNEYWTRKARVNFDRFIDEGKNALILSGNTMWWQVRYSADGNQMICYKSSKDPEPKVELMTYGWYSDALKYLPEKSLGVTFDLGGYGDYNNKGGFNGFKVVCENSPLLKGTGLKNGDVISCLSKEYDGTPVKYIPNYEHPIINNIHNFHKIELIGYDKGFRTIQTIGTFIALKRTANSGVMVNTASTDWCSKYGIGGKDGEKIKKITINAIELLLAKENVFSI